MNSIEKNEKRETVMNDVFTQWPGAFIASSITKNCQKVVENATMN